TIRITEVVVLSFKMHRPMGMGRIHRHAAHRIDHAALPGRTISSRTRRVGRTVYSSRTWKVGRTTCLNSTLVVRLRRHGIVPIVLAFAEERLAGTPLESSFTPERGAVDAVAIRPRLFDVGKVNFVGAVALAGRHRRANRVERARLDDGHRRVRL